MTTPSIANAFVNVPTSSDKTNILADLNSLYSDLSTAQGNSRFSANVLAELQDTVVLGLAQTIAKNMGG